MLDVKCTITTFALIGLGVVVVLHVIDSGVVVLVVVDSEVVVLGVIASGDGGPRGVQFLMREVPL